MYFIVVGAGNTGSNLIELAMKDGNDVVVIEEDEEVANEVADEYDCMVLNQDAASEDALEDAGVERADAVISTTDDDSVNIMVMLLASEHEVPSLVSVVREPKHMGIYEKIGVNIVENPERLIADYLYHSVRYPQVKDFMDVGRDTELVQITVEDDASIVDVELGAARDEGILGEDTVVVAVKRDDEILTPKGSTVLQPGDLVTVFVNESAIGDAVEVFAPSSER